MGYRIRPAIVGDAAEIVRQRIRMFEDMGMGTSAQHEKIRIPTLHFLTDAIQQGLYRGWLAETDDGKFVAGGGVLMTPWPPSALDGKSQRPYIINMYTDPAYRRQGLARMILKQILAFLHAEGFSIARLNASKSGRPLYETLGFQPSNEMIFPLDTAS
jgi:GNAT superfamily N-acetyltransferase